MIDCIPSLVNEEDNALLTALPSFEELKEVVFSISTHSAPRPDGFNGVFFQKSWDIFEA